jgi:hypothetical protein
MEDENMQDVISPKDIDHLITQLRSRTDLSLAEVACRVMWSLVDLAGISTSLSADELRELGHDIEAPKPLYPAPLFHREWRLKGSSCAHHEHSFRFESHLKPGFCLSVRIRLTTDNCDAE